MHGPHPQCRAGPAETIALDRDTFHSGAASARIERAAGRSDPFTGLTAWVPVDFAGEKVELFYWSANRDEAVFVDPYRFDVRRNPNPHVGFGGPGPHFCLGAHLARREITVMFRELFSRLGAVEITGEPEMLLSAFIHGVKHLPCRFVPAS